MGVLEIGCGWDGPTKIAYARGAHVHGVTLSEGQRRYTVERLAGRPWTRVELRDCRDLDGAYGAITSVGMSGTVDEAYWPSYFRTLVHCLRHGGRVLVQSIAVDEAYFEYYHASIDFVQQFIFPDDMLPSRERFIKLAKQHSLCVVGRLDFGHDYAETLRRWSQRFEARLNAVRVLKFGNSFICI